MKKYNIISALCFIALGVYVLIEAQTYNNKGIGQQNPGLWPSVLAVGMILFSVILIVQSLVKKEVKKDTSAIDAKLAEAKAAAEAKGEEFDEKEFLLELKAKEAEEGGFLSALTEEETEINWTTPGMLRVYAAIGMTIAFLVIMHFFGMMIGLACLIPGIMWLMNTKKIALYIAVDAGIIAFVYIFFVKVMTITLPTGIFF